MQTALIALTLVRAPLAFLFLIDSPLLRVSAVLLAMITDSIDGWLARRFRSTSRLGAILDPIMDKFFVVFVLLVLFTEHRISTWGMTAMLSRDISLIIFAIYLLSTRQFKPTEFRAIILGKISTALQFGAIVTICMRWAVNENFYYVFITLSSLALIELFWYQFKKVNHRKPSPPSDQNQ